jgi:hypothetical protein
VRRFMTAIAIVVAALGLVWLVRLDRTPASSDATVRNATIAGSPPPSSQVNAPPVVPTPVLGRVGGKLPDVLVDPRIVIEKARRTLTVFSDEHPVKTYRIALGRNPAGDKEREGDLRTPEGVFYVCTKNPNSRYHLSLGLSYPNSEDAERGLASGLISKRQHRAIDEAIAHYRQPPWNTKLGGEIMIHGNGVTSDWTNGCVATSNSDMDEIFGRLPLGTRVEIRP